MFNWQYLLTLIPIAVIISIIVFLVRYFGKVIADQVPITDSRSWHEELGGIMFFVNFIVSPIILILIAYSKNIKADTWLFIVSIISIVVLNLVNAKAKKFFLSNEFDDGNIGLLLKKAFSSDLKLTEGDWIIFLNYLILPGITFFIIIMLTYFYKWHAYYHLAGAVTYLFFHLTGFAMFSSLKKVNIVMANIKFIDKDEKELENCRILKVNDDNVRVNTGEKVIILNKSLISKIEILKNNKKRHE